MVITDGQSSDFGAFPAALSAADRKSVLRFAIGVRYSRDMLL